MRTEFNIPAELNGKQLNTELNNAGVELEYTPHIEEGFLILHINESDIEKARTVINNHIPVFIEPTVADKLASVGLSLEELREALGSN